VANGEVDPKFIEAMNDIGRYGYAKYGDIATKIGNRGERHRAYQLSEHAEEHFFQYLRGVPHDHFNTRRHQLAAVAYNAMMEFILAGLESER
jgi:hypothetical protein